MKPNYEAGFSLLMNYWDFIPEEDKEDVNKQLLSFGL